jgi:hypothetical protein
MKKSKAAKAIAFMMTVAVGWENIKWSPLDSAWSGLDMSLEENLHKPESKGKDVGQDEQGGQPFGHGVEEVLHQGLLDPYLVSIDVNCGPKVTDLTLSPSGQPRLQRQASSSFWKA